MKIKVFSYYIIYILYQKEKKFKDKINELPLVPCDTFLLANVLNSNYNEKDFQCSFNKIRKSGDCVTSNVTGKTNYCYMLEKYKFYAINQNWKFNLDITIYKLI